MIPSAQLNLALTLVASNTDPDWRQDALAAVHQVCLTKGVSCH